MKLLTIDDVKLEMKKYFAADELGRCEADGYLDDYARIGALLTDEDACRPHLHALNKALKAAAPALNVSTKTSVNLHNEQKGKIKAQDQSKDVAEVTKNFYAWTGSADGKAYHAKFKGLLTSVLQKQEEAFCFNGVGPTQPVGRKTTLTGFVQPGDFTSKLLAQGLHWKDPGARLTHGEFSHRLQWWILMSDKASPSSGKYTLKNDLKALYTHLPDYRMNTGDGKVMWDFLFDCFLNQSPASDAYRTPDVLHGALLEGKDFMLDLLSSVIRARHNKRQYMENHTVVDGSAYEAYINWKIQAKGGYDLQHQGSKIVYQKAA